MFSLYVTGRIQFSESDRLKTFSLLSVTLLFQYEGIGKMVLNTGSNDLALSKLKMLLKDRYIW